MLNKELHPIVQVLLTLLFVSFLMIFLISFIMTYFPNGDFDEINTKYKLELQLTMVISSLGSMFFIYSNLRYRVKKNAAELNETTPIIHWNYEKLYWRKFKTKEYQKKGLLYLLKIALIWMPIGFFVFFLFKVTNPMVSIILVALILIFTIPMIPFTLGRFFNDLKNQLFQKKYEIKIYKNGLTVNEIYYPYNHWIDNENNLRLIDVQELNLYNTRCLKFIAKKVFYSPPTPDGGDSGSVIRRTVNTFIPIPKNQDIDLHKIKKELKIKT